jgi:hypothetical protein
MSSKECDRGLIDAVSDAIQKIENLEVLILSWEERLRACEQRSTAPAMFEMSGFSSTSSYHDEPLSLGSLPFTSLSSHIGTPAKCAVKSCENDTMADKRFCRRHISRACHYPGCTKTRLGPQYCIRHGGGKRCEVEGCTKGASGTVGGGARFCIAHGGGRRCRVDGCRSTAKRDGLCSSHGGRYECVVSGCSKTAHGPRRLCTMHGGRQSSGT